MKNFWYHYVVHPWMRLGLLFFFQRIRVYGKNNISKDKAVIFLPNHQNAFMDALIINTRHHRTTHTLVRASIFGKKWTDFLLNSINLMPVYRIRDGVSQMNKNQEVFKSCFEILKKGECLLIHPEGNHALQKFLRPISKGFTRIGLGALENNPDLDFELIPVGVNYSHSKLFFGKASVHFGKPINPQSFKDHPQELKKLVEIKMRELIVNIPEKNYETNLEVLDRLEADYSDLKASNQLISNYLIENRPAPKLKAKRINPIHVLVSINNIFFIILWKKVSKKLKDPAFHSSIKFCFGLFLFPLYHALLFLFLESLFSGLIAVFYLLFSLISLPFLSKRFKYLRGTKHKPF